MNFFGWHSSGRGFRRALAPAGMPSPPSERSSEKLRHSDSNCGMESGGAALQSLAKVTCFLPCERISSPHTGDFKQDRSGCGELNSLPLLGVEWASEALVETVDALLNEA